MKRRCSVLVLLWLLPLLCGADMPSSRHPNVVIILTDDMGYGDVSRYNPDSKIQTPHMDALADESVWCTDVHATSSICSPSRYGLLTGRYPWRGKLKFGITDVFEESTIEAGRYCLPQMLKDQGYDTACIGKWHLGFEWPWRDGVVPKKFDRRDLQPEAFDWSKPIEGGPLAIGFDHYFGDDVPNFAPYAFIEDDHLTCDPVYVTRDRFSAVGEPGGLRGDGPGQADWSLEAVMPEITRRAVDYVVRKSKKETPFFLYFATTSPHTPVVPTKEFQGKSDAGFYGDYVIQTDDAVGQVVAALKANGCFENTLLIVTSDNGPCYYAYERLIKEKGHDASGILRGMKAETWEGGHRIPFIVSWPKGGLSGGRESDALISLADIFGTVADILNVQLPEHCAEDTQSAWASLTQNAVTRKEMVHLNGAGFMGLRQNEWVLIEGPAGREESVTARKAGLRPSRDLPVQLFNLREDPMQQTDVSASFPEKISAMSERLEEIRSGDRTR